MTSVAFHVDQLFSPAPGGIGTYIRELVPRLAKEADVTLFHAAFADDPLDDLLHRLPRHALAGSARWLYPTWDLLGRPPLPEALRSHDIVHAPNPAAIPPAGPGQRLVVTVHDLAFRPFPRLFPPRWLALYRLGTRRAARRADAILVPSASTARDLVRHEKADRARVHVVPLAASLPRSRTDPDETLRRMKVRHPYVLFVGTLEPRKNLLRLVRAYRHAVAHGGLPHRLVLAGPLGWQPEALMREIRLGGPGEVVLTGKAGIADLDALYRGASLFVYPSLYEGFGLPILEAMARGVPTVTSNVSSMPEVAGDAALQVDPRSVEGIASAIELLLSDLGEAERLARAGLARSEAFTWERTAERTLEIYRSL